MKNFLYQKLQFSMSRLHENTSALKSEHPALQKMKFINFFHFCPLGSGYGSRNSIESGSGSTALANIVLDFSQ
jgi:hypothetical protein